MADLVTLAEVKVFLNIDHSDDDTLLDGLIDYYTAVIEEYCDHDFTQASQTEYLDGGQRDLIVGKLPIASITSIADTEDDDALADADDYDFDPDAGLIYLTSNSGIWTRGRRRWKVIYVAGHDGAPSDVKLATFKLIAGDYSRRDSGLKSEHLGDYSYIRFDDFPADVKVILSKYTRITI